MYIFGSFALDPLFWLSSPSSSSSSSSSSYTMSSRSSSSGGVVVSAVDHLVLHQRLTNETTSFYPSPSNNTCFPTSVVHTKGLWFGEDPLNYSLDLLLFELPIISIVTCAIYLLLKPLGHPTIVPQILGGLVLGPSFLGHSKEFMRTVFPIRGKVILETFSLFGFVFFQFLIGVRMDPNIIFESGKRAIAIGISGYFSPVIFGGFISIFLKNFTKMDTSVSRVLRIIVSAQSMSSFPVISCFLSDLKILNSELGRLASSSSMISDICSFVTLVFFRISFMVTGENGYANTIGAVSSSLLLFAIVAVLVRPAALWVIRQTPQGKPVKEIYLFGFIVMVLVCTFISQMTGQGYTLAPFVLGLVIPDGPPLGSALEERLDSFVSVLLMPIFFTLCGLKADLFTLDESLWVIQVVIFTCFMAKTIGIILPNLYCRMPLRDALILALIMNSKGIVELALYNSWLEDQILTRKVFTIMIISLLITTVIVSRLVQTLYDPARRYLPYRRRTIQHARRDAELGILACVHSQDNVPNLIQLLEISSSNKENPIHVCILHLVELVGRATSLLITHQRNSNKRGNTCAKPGQSEDIIKAFRYYEQNNNKQAGGLVWVDIMTSICPCVTMHDDVCSLALEKRASLIIMPFHKQWVAEGAIESSTAIQNLNFNVLEKAPCSVGILVSHRYMSASQTVMLPSKQMKMFCVAIIFFGGADDREALAYAARMADNPNVRLTLLRFMSKDNMYTDERMKILDNDILVWFKNETLDNDRVWSKEEIVSDGAGVMSVIRSMENGGYDLVMVGRRHMDSPLTSGLTEWTEHPELGIIGDILATPDFKGVPSVLVVQQQVRVWGMHTPD